MRRTELQISLSALENNLKVIKSFTNASVQGVVKANFYGLFDDKMHEIIEQNVESYAVITIDEAVSLRKLTSKPILLFQGVHEQNDYEMIEENNLDFTIHSSWQLEGLSDFNLKNSRIWLKLNTGMNRLGFNDKDFLIALKEIEILNIKDIVLMSHLASSETKSNPNNLKQIKKFIDVTKKFSYLKSMANTGGIFNFKEAHFDIVRPGIGIYGGKYSEFGIKPVTKLRSKIISINKVRKGESVGYDGMWTAQESSRVAAVGIGYADGLPFFSSEKTVIINGEKFYTAGMLSMDLMLVNLGKNVKVKVGDWVDIWGFENDLSNIAQQFETISYKLLTNISSRVSKNYIE